MNPEDRQSDLEHCEVVCYLAHLVARPDKSDEKEKGAADPAGLFI